MSVDNAILFSLVTLLLTSNAGNVLGELCVTRTACSCVTSNGEGYDLSILDHGNQFIESTTVLNQTFYFWPCGNQPLNIPSKNTSACSSSSGVSLCMYDAGKNASTYLGNVTDSKMTLQSEDKPQIVFDHVLGSGTHYTATINLLCNPFFEIPTIFAQYTGKDKGSDHNFVLASRRACKVPMHVGGLSTGSILVIILFVFSGIYFIGGALILKLLRGATGWEMLPNQKFWFDLPVLVRDGIAFTLNGCKVVSYDQI